MAFFSFFGVVFGAPAGRGTELPGAEGGDRGGGWRHSYEQGPHRVDTRNGCGGWSLKIPEIGA
jgi:hypothetical protein